jgi:DNA polymerase I-like protein with 3'-5' exonuclease and polymerase domains
MWHAPRELPDLRRVGLLALDTETRDDGLASDHGSGWPTRNGHLCGVSVAYRADGEVHGLYFPVRHPDSANFDFDQVRRWLTDHVAADLRFVTQNGLYDWGWLRADAGIRMPPGDRLEEIGALATMVDENRYRYSLEALCQWRGLPGKDETLLREGCQALELIENRRKKFKPQNYLWRLPASYVGPYAEADAINTLLLFESLDPVLEEEGTRAAYRLECDLLPMVHEMRRRGVRIDVNAAERARDLLLSKRDAVLAEISDKLGTLVSMNELQRSAWLAETFDREKIKYPRTAKGNPSFTGGQSGWMDKHAHWLPRLIRQADKYNNAGANFVGNYILGYAVDGRIHAEIHPHRSEANGTKSFRFSYSDPPLQLMSARDEELAALIRGVFLPEEGEVWAKPDASQQEFRFAVHYAVCHHVPKSERMLERYLQDPDTDFHALTAVMTALERKDAKAVNFGKIYGAGIRKFAAMIGRPEAEAKQLYEQYDRQFPFLRALSRIYQSIARRQGYITLYDGARRHFNTWAPGGQWSKGAGPCERAEAQRRLADPEHPWHGKSVLYRAEVHTALNALIQGSAARHTKLWMRACWREGIVPLLQMHDALECSVSTREQAEMVARLCVDAVKLKVPMKVDLKFGRNWGDARHSWDELHGRGEEISPACPVLEGIPSTPIQPQPQDAPAAIPEPPAAPYLNGTHVEVPPSEIIAPVSLRDIVGRPLVHNKVLCPFHDDHSPSCHIYPDHYYCYVCGAHGDAINWLMQVDGYSYAEALEVFDNWDPALHVLEDPKRTLELAQKLWSKAGPIIGTLAERYLTSRHIDVGQLPPGALRFHPDCPFGPDTRHPCLLALFSDIASNAFAGIHRTALTADAQKIDRRTLGRWSSPRAIKLWPAGHALVVGEGLETVAAAATRVNFENGPLRPAWALGSSWGLRNFQPPAGVEWVVVLADNDLAGREAARECSERCSALDCSVAVLTPKITNQDFNDLVRGRAS